MKIYTILILCLLFISSCKNKEDVTIFEGEWEDASPETFLGGERYEFNFRDGSFTIRKYSYSDVARLVCDKYLLGGQYNYYSGFFHLRNDSLFLKGTFVKSTIVNGKKEMNIPDCNNKYGKEYKYAYKTRFENDTLKLYPREDVDFPRIDLEKNDSTAIAARNRMTIFLTKKGLL